MFNAILFGILICGVLLLGLIIFPICLLVKVSRIQKELEYIRNKLSHIAAGFTEKSPQTAPTAAAPSPAPTPTTTPIPAPVPVCSTPSSAVVRTEEKSYTPPVAEPIARPTPKPTVAAASPLETKLSDLEERTNALLRRIWNWICVGEEFRPKDSSREYAVATTWLTRIGVLVLLFGIGFFLKYSIDRNWINPAIRVGGMTLTGLAMAAIGIRLERGKYRTFAVALAGAGFVTLYLSVMAGYSLYHLFGSSAAFAMLSLVTITAMLSAVGLNAIFPALLGCIGGYLTPVFLSTGSRNLTGLMLYLTLLSAGTLIVSKYRDWVFLHIAALFFYCIVSGGGVIQLLTEENYPATLGLLSLNFVLFAIQVLLRRDRKSTTLLEFFLLGGNLAFYLGCSIPIGLKYGAEYYLAAGTALFAAATFLAEVVYLSRKHPGEKALRIFTLTLVCVCVCIAVPLLFGGVWLTAAWSAAALAMVFIASKTRSKTLMTLAFLLYILTFVREMMTRNQFCGFESSGLYWSFLRDQLLSYGVFLVSLVLSAVLLLRQTARELARKSNHSEPPPTFSGIGMTFAVLSALIFWAVSSFELVRSMRVFLPWFDEGVLVLWWTLFALALLILGTRFRWRAANVPPLVLFGMAFFCYFAHFDACDNLSYWAQVRYHLLTAGVYLLSLLGGGWILFRQAGKVGEAGEKNFLRKTAFVFFGLFGVLFFLDSSNELHRFLSVYEPPFRNGGVSVWWSVCAVGLIFFGIRKQIKALRMCGIWLFAACALKVFFLDLSELDQLWRIVAFLVIGVLTLVGAVLYMRFKNLFAPSAEGGTNEEENRK